jgi:EmrB/QacA subfamily drug resistance transporter
MTKKWLVFTAVFLASSMIFLDQAILPVSLSTIQQYFSLSSSQVSWIINSYRLAIAALILFGGKMGDTFGLKQVFTFGMASFGLFSLLCGFSTSFFSLIIFRMLQGISAAFVIPTLSPLLFDVFHKDQRGFAVGLKVSLSSVVMAVAPYLGGVLTQYLSWKWIFWINPIIALIGLLLLVKVNPLISQKKKASFDFLSFAFFSSAFLSLTFGLMQGKSWGWTSIPIMGLFVLCLLFGYALFYWERKEKNAQIFFTYFKDRTFALSILNIIIVQIVLSTTIFWPIFLQQVINYSPSQTGFIMMFSFAPMLIAAPIAGKMVDRYGPKKPLVIGNLFSFVSLLLVSFFISEGGIGLMVSFILMGFFTTLAFTPAFIGSLNVFPQNQRSNVSAILNGARSFAMSLGIALMGAILLTSQSNAFSRFLKSDIHTATLDPKAFDGLLAKVPKVVEYAQSLSIEEQLVATAKIASHIGIVTMTLIGAFLCLAMAVILYFFMENKRRIHEEIEEIVP